MNIRNDVLWFGGSGIVPFEDPQGPNSCRVCVVVPKHQIFGLSMAQVYRAQDLSWWPDGRHSPHPQAPTSPPPGPRRLQDGPANSRNETRGGGSAPFSSSLVPMKPCASGRHDVNGGKSGDVTTGPRCRPRYENALCVPETTSMQLLRNSQKGTPQQTMQEAGCPARPSRFPTTRQTVSMSPF